MLLTMGMIGCLLGAPLISYWLVPSFKRECDRTGSASLYSFLEKRFSLRVRTTAASLFLLRTVLYLAVVLYAPAVALSSVLSVPETVLIVFTGVLATCISAKGGIRAVAIVDFLQSIPLVLSASVVLVTVSVRIKGQLSGALALPESAWSVRNVYDDNVWFFMFGQLGSFVAQCGADQVAVQRFLLTADIKAAQRSAMQSSIANVFFQTTLCLCGAALVPYLRDKGVAAPSDSDQILPFVLNLYFPTGCTGVFLAAVLGCTVSVASAAINSACACAIEDIETRMFGWRQMRGPALLRRARLHSIALGAAATCMSLLASVLGGSLVVMSSAALGLTLGPTLGIFMLGLQTRIGSRAASAAYACGIALMVALAGDQFGAYRFAAKKLNVWMLSPVLTGFTFAVGLVAGWLCENTEPESSAIQSVEKRSRTPPPAIINKSCLHCNDSKQEDDDDEPGLSRQMQMAMGLG